jgi:hypothetical protein
MPLRVIFRRARRQIPVNPTAGLEIVAARKKPRRIVAPDVAAKMIAALPVEDRALRATAFYAGLRNGELQALKVEDIELFEEGRWGLIHVRRGWDKVEGVQEPKSTAGVRSVPVCEQLYENLDEHLLRLGWSEGLTFGRMRLLRTATAASESGQRAPARTRSCSQATCSSMSAVTPSRPGLPRQASRSSAGTSTAATPTSRWTRATPTNWTISTSTTHARSATTCDAQTHPHESSKRLARALARRSRKGLNNAKSDPSRKPFRAVSSDEGSNPSPSA